MKVLYRASIRAQIEEDHLAIRDGFHAALATSGRADRAKLAWIRRADAAELWRRDGHRHMASFVAAEAHISPFKARRWIEAAHALELLPHCAAALESGALSLDKVVELTRFVTEADEDRWVRWATKKTASQVRCRAELEVKRDQKEATERQKDRSVTWWREDELTHIQAVLPGEDGIRATKAIDALARELGAERDGAGSQESDALRADALTLLVTGDVSKDTTVIVHAPLDALLSDEGSAAVEGSTLHPETARRLLCDCRLKTAVEQGSGPNRTLLGLSSASRIVSPSLREMVLERDGYRCTFHGCGTARYLDIHHVTHWVHNGETKYDNLVSLCHHHHKQVHEYGWSVILNADGTTTWFRPGGRVYEPGVPLPKELPERLPDKPRLAELLKESSRLLGFAAVF